MITKTDIACACNHWPIDVLNDVQCKGATPVDDFIIIIMMMIAKIASSSETFCNQSINW